MLLCPSMMCANYDNLKSEIIALSEAGSDIFHVDIMDGSFVPNYAMGLEDIKCIKRNTDKPVDVHLMVNNPSEVLDIFIDAGADIVYVHPETDVHIAKTLLAIREKGKKSGIAINPGTSISTVECILPLCDYILVMTVNPGFAGQKYLDFVDEKIEKLVELKYKYSYKIMIDGACSPQVISEKSKKGVEGFVLGTSALFNKGRDYKDLMHELRAL